MPTTRTIDHGILEEKSEHKRPDRAETLKRAHEAAEHDAWFREQVQLALDEADQPDAVYIPHEVVKSEWAERREELMMKAMEGKR